MAIKKRGRPEPAVKRRPIRSKTTAQVDAPSSSDEEFPETTFDDDESPSEASDSESAVEVSADEEDLPHIFLGDKPDNVGSSDAESHSDADSTEQLDIDSDSHEEVEDEELTGDDLSELEDDSQANDHESTLISSADDATTDAFESSKPKRRTKINWDTYVEERKILPEIDADYASDSSTEDPVNTVGKIPMEWYDEYPHIGYDIDGKRIMRPATKDELDKFLDTVDDPDKMISAPNGLAQQDMKLSDYELEIIKRLQRGYFPDAAYDPYEPTVEYFTSQVREQPLPTSTEPKRRFLPSKWEHQRIAKIVRGIRAGRIVLNRAPVEKPQLYDLWGAADDDSQDPIRGISQHMPAPKMAPPGHAESYHPPREYLLTPEEVEQVKQRAEDRGDLNAVAQLPRDHTSLRMVPAYSRLIQERFQRCLDLYLCPRKLAKRIDADPESLMPKLPDPKDLHPYPTTMAMAYRGHTGMVRCVSVDPSGYWMLSGSDDNTLRLWEIKTGRCAKVWRFSEAVQAVAWNPNRSICMFAVASGTRVSLMTPPAHTVCDDDTYTLTEELLAFTQANAEDGQEDVNQDPSLLQDEDDANEEDDGNANHQENGEEEEEAVDARRGDLNSAQRARKLVAWSRPSAKEQQQHNIRYVLHHTRVVQQVTWHRKGDYFSTVCQHRSQSAKTSSFVLIHLLSQRKSQKPFRENKGGAVQKVAFHPTRPHFIVATQRFVRVYDLMRQATTKTLIPGAQWISSVDVHPQGGDTGDHIIVGTYDKKLCWFDLDLSTKPYKVIKFHPKAIRQVCFHPKFPLFTSASDDGTLQVFHATVYKDLLQNPLIVPVKILRGHRITNSLGVLNCQFHPIQPWLISTGADGTIRLWT